MSRPQEFRLQPISDSLGLINMRASLLPTPTVAVWPRNTVGQYISNTCFPLSNAVENNMYYYYYYYYYYYNIVTNIAWLKNAIKSDEKTCRFYMCNGYCTHIDVTSAVPHISVDILNSKTNGLKKMIESI